ncbi:MAG: retroviral-like aspartic protease family protein, partial [Candidatus Obscuribacterales bacterium]|nr:retroviral-like aspartic protease family protein [Candidatus Obscuribacterales bacterium]
ANEFVNTVTTHPDNSNAIYYAAASFHRAGDMGKARTYYKLLLDKFPSSPGAKYARQALNPSASAKTARTNTSTSAMSKSADTIPDSDSVPFRRENGGHLYVNCLVNGRSLPMIFDTGAEVCTIGKKMAASLGLSIPPNARKMKVAGVGGAETAYSVPANIQLGNISRTIDVLFMENSKYALLGQTFFGDLRYRVDNASGRIDFSKPGASNDYVPLDTINIPFKRSGNNLVVEAKVNGASIPMFFDTGAQGTLFTGQALSVTSGRGFREAGMATSSGVGGSHLVKLYYVDSVELGPIRVSNMKVTVDNSLPVPYGLLGQDFFGRRQFTIDDKQQVIRFLR